MAATVIAFRPDPHSPACSQPVAELVRLQQMADEFLPCDIPAIENYLPRLKGDWAIRASRGEALLIRRQTCEMDRQLVLIRREGNQLRLMIDRPPYGPEPIGLFHSMALVMEILGEEVGWQ